MDWSWIWTILRVICCLAIFAFTLATLILVAVNTDRWKGKGCDNETEDIVPYAPFPGLLTCDCCSRCPYNDQLPPGQRCRCCQLCQPCEINSLPGGCQDYSGEPRFTEFYLANKKFDPTGVPAPPVLVEPFLGVTPNDTAYSCVVTRLPEEYWDSDVFLLEVLNNERGRNQIGMHHQVVYVARADDPEYGMLEDGAFVNNCFSPERGPNQLQRDIISAWQPSVGVNVSFPENRGVRIPGDGIILVQYHWHSPLWNQPTDRPDDMFFAMKFRVGCAKYTVPTSVIITGAYPFSTINIPVERTPNAQDVTFPVVSLADGIIGNNFVPSPATFCRPGAINQKFGLQEQLAALAGQGIDLNTGLRIYRAFGHTHGWGIEASGFLVDLANDTVTELFTVANPHISMLQEVDAILKPGLTLMTQSVYNRSEGVFTGGRNAGQPCDCTRTSPPANGVGGCVCGDYALGGPSSSNEMSLNFYFVEPANGCTADQCNLPMIRAYASDEVILGADYIDPNAPTFPPTGGSSTDAEAPNVPFWVPTAAPSKCLPYPPFTLAPTNDPTDIICQEGGCLWTPFTTCFQANVPGCGANATCAQEKIGFCLQNLLRPACLSGIPPDNQCVQFQLRCSPAESAWVVAASSQTCTPQI